jgi:hypothetical protein
MLGHEPHGEIEPLPQLIEGVVDLGSSNLLGNIIRQ